MNGSLGLVGIARTSRDKLDNNGWALMVVCVHCLTICRMYSMAIRLTHELLEWLTHGQEPLDGSADRLVAGELENFSRMPDWPADGLRSGSAQLGSAVSLEGERTG